MSRPLYLILATFLVAFPFTKSSAKAIKKEILTSETPQAKGLRLAKENEAANKGVGGETSTMKLLLIDAHGASVEREMLGQDKEGESEGDKSISTFVRPEDVKGTKMITWGHKEKEDDQWLYLNTLRKVKRISSSGKSASFMGSEFSYEDLGSQNPEKFEYKFLKDEKVSIDGKSFDAYLVERTPKETSAYSRQEMLIVKNWHNPYKVKYFDKKGELLKEALFSDYKSYNVSGKSLWRPGKIEMNNTQTMKKSVISWTERKLGVKIDDKEFDPNKFN